MTTNNVSVAGVLDAVAADDRRVAVGVDVDVVDADNDSDTEVTFKLREEDVDDVYVSEWLIKKRVRRLMHVLTSHRTLT